MSCPYATAPIDICAKNVAGKCDLKCDYQFKYSNSSCTATNRGNHIKLSYDQTSIAPVIYNATSYSVEQVRIYTPSLHSFCGTKSDGELIIVHRSNTGADQLLVCIPIKIDDAKTPGSTLLGDIVSAVAQRATEEDEETSVTTKHYDLTSIVPREPFFSYTATEPYQPCSENTNYIVFDTTATTFNMTESTYKTFQKVIESSPYDVKVGAKLYYNAAGPKIAAGEDDIYIDCQPVGQSEDTTTTTSTSSGENAMTEFFDDPFASPAFMFVLVVIFGFVLFIVIYFAINMITSSIHKSPSTSGAKT